MRAVYVATDLPGFENELYEMVRAFFPDAAFVREGADIEVGHVCVPDGEGFRQEVRLFLQGAWRDGNALAPRGESELEEKRNVRRAAKMALYRLLKEATGFSPPWGGLTGVRPTRLLAERYALGESRPEALAALHAFFDVHPSKLALLADCCEMQRGFLAHPPEEVDIYVGIPFCPTRCSYCSFASEPMSRARKHVEPYLGALQRELTAGAALLQRQGLRPRAVYVGGGTPTSLTTEQLQRLLFQLRTLFPQAAEWTVEAGRPDSVDLDKLKAIFDAGVRRISVNPQTMNDETLARIGRGHTAAQLEEAYFLARRCGFTCINMDLIIALPGERLADVAATLQRVLALAPDNLTVHTLAVKRGAALTGLDAPADEAAAMVDLGAQAARASGLLPYYVYRQKHMAGGLENVGYAVPGKQCLYNIDQMEETVACAAFGAGAITKWLYPAQRRIERAANVRPIADYIARIDEMVARKAALIAK